MKNKIETISQKIIKNTKFNIIGKFWTLLVGLFLTPYIVKKLGVELFGIWAIISVITGFFSLFDFGIGSSFVKYIAEYNTKKEYNKINEIINTGIVLYILLSVFIIFISVCFIDLILNFLKIPVQYLNVSKQVYILSIILFCATSIISPIVSIQGALQRLDITNKISILFSIPMAIGAILFLENGYGIKGLIYNSIILFCLNSLTHIVIAYKVLPNLNINLFKFNKNIALKIWSYGYKLQIANISAQISLNIDKIIISNLLSIGMVTYYQLGSSIIDKIKSFSILIFSPMMPAFVELEAKGDRAKFIQGYTLGTKYLSLIITPFFIFIMMSSSQIMAIWMGSGYEKSEIIIIILGLGYLLAVLSGMRSIGIQAIGKTHIEMWSGIVAMILNIPLSIASVMIFGFSGVAIGTSISLLCSVIYGIISFHREIKLPTLYFLKLTVINSFIYSLLCALIIFLSNFVLQHLIQTTDRVSNLIFFVIQGIIFFAVYLIILFLKKPLLLSELQIILHGQSQLFYKILNPFCKKNTIIKN